LRLCASCFFFSLKKNCKTVANKDVLYLIFNAKKKQEAQREDNDFYFPQQPLGGESQFHVQQQSSGPNTMISSR
jgi:hypothetical protein